MKASALRCPRCGEEVGPAPEWKIGRREGHVVKVHLTNLDRIERAFGNHGRECLAVAS